MSKKLIVVGCFKSIEEGKVILIHFSVKLSDAFTIKNVML